jgi:hypothetical protein
MPGGGVKR